MENQRVQQGDVIIQPCKIPVGAERVEKADGALAYGEVTGHSHRVSSGVVEFLKFHSKTYLRVIETATIVHEEHRPIVRPPGDYQYGVTQEFDYDAMESRRVAD